MVITKDLGAVSAYAYAVEQGYQGTEEEFAELMARQATVAEEAAASADAAAESASEAQASAEQAEQSAQSIEGDVERAEQAATTATGKATEAATSATTANGAAQTATGKAAQAEQSATAAANSASAAATSASNAAASATAAQTAQTAAETAQAAAEQAASSVSESAAQIAKNTANFASEFSASTTYAIGDYCIHEGTLYRFINEHTGAWSASDVEETNVGGEIGDVKSALSDYQNAISEYIKPTNLYNKNSNLNHNDVSVSASGNFRTLSGSSVSHPIKIDKTKSYVFKFSLSYYGAAANRIVRRCDAEGNLVDLDAGFMNAQVVDNAYGNIPSSYWARHSDWEYFCVNVRTADKGVMIIAEGDTLPAYSDYFDPYWVILESALPPEIPLPANAENNPLYGKKLSVDGDSIMYGAGYTGGFAKIIAENNSMPVQNIAKTGATLATGTTSEGVNRQWICTHIANIAGDADYILFDGGVNDAALSVPLGTLTSGYTDTLDTSTIIGALETACKTLQTTYAGKKYGFVFPHDCYNWSNSFTTTWKPAMKECLKKWGVPFIDLGELTGQLNNISALRQYTQNNDGWHPTEEGYRLFYVDKITAWMKTL